MFQMKPDFEEVLNRYEAWWDCEIIDRPLVSIAFALPEDQRQELPQKKHATMRDRWMDSEYLAEEAEINLRNTVHFADDLPIAWPNLGPELFSAFYGCEMEYRQTTAWSKPILFDWSRESINNLQLNTEGFYFQKLMEMTDTLLARGKDKFIVGYSDLHAGGDAIAALRDPQELLVDVIDNPDAIKSLCDKITTDFLEIYDMFYEKLSAAGMPSANWCPATCKGKFHTPSNDFSCMISTEAFEELFLPGIIRECQHMDRCLYHLDGAQALRYLDLLLDVPEIHAIQWVPSSGQDYWADWIEVYQRIQSKNKALHICSMPAKDLKILFEALSPEGVWIGSLSGISNQHEAEAALGEISQWTTRQ